MRIVMIAQGSMGDVQPYAALGKGLVQAGHFVRIVSNQNYETLVKSHGLDFWPIEVNMEDLIRSEKMREVLESGKLLSSMAQMSKEIKYFATILADRGLAACQGMDLVVAGISGVFAAYSFAEKLGLPLLQAYNIPFTPTSAFPGALLPNFPKFLYYTSHKITRQIVWQAYRPTDKIIRHNILGLPNAPTFGPFNTKFLKEGPILYGFSPSVIPRPADWKKNIHLTGFWSLPPTENWNPPSDLRDFLQTGSPPLYIGFGSMSNKAPEETATLLTKALQKTNQRAIIFSGWSGLNKTHLPESVLMIDAVPHTWLFPRCSAVIHHGGAGTTAAGLIAGVPSIVVPFHGDQPFWGRCIANLGVSPLPIPRTKLNPDLLANAIHEVVSNIQMRDRSAALGKNLRAEDGISNAVQIIQNQYK